MSTLFSRPTRILTVAALVASAVTLTGCSSGSKSTSTSTSTSSASSSSTKSMPRTVSATARSESRDITTAFRGQTFTVRLPTSNGSGYSWRLAPSSAEDKFVHLQDLKQQQNAESDMVGASADDVFTFRANRTGQTTIQFVYDRPWSDQAPVRTFTLDVDVYKNAKALAQANAESSMEE